MHYLILVDNSEEKRKSWKQALELNQIDSHYEPSPLLTDMMEKEIQGDLSSDEIVERLKQSYRQPE